MNPVLSALVNGSIASVVLAGAEEIASRTGGYHVVIKNEEDALSEAAKVSVGLRNSHVLRTKALKIFEIQIRVCSFNSAMDG